MKYKLSELTPKGDGWCYTIHAPGQLEDIRCFSVGSKKAVEKAARQQVKRLNGQIKPGPIKWSINKEQSQ